MLIRSNKLTIRGMTNTAISVRHLDAWYKTKTGKLHVLDNVSLEVEEGEIVSIVGPSGCGKTTFLNIILGLITDDMDIKGELIIAGYNILSTTHKDMLNFYKKIGIGYVSQKDTLLPWKTVLDNILLGCKFRSNKTVDYVNAARQYIKLTGLNGFEGSYPSQLSGGMRQRCMIARSLVYNPAILVMDEPLGALDAYTRMVLQKELTYIFSVTKKTTLFVTHDIDEAIIVGTKIVVMSKRPGKFKRIFKCDIPYPRDPFKVKDTDEFKRLRDLVWQALKTEAE
jgi:NitT/TauT family transport system ATP-binding protein